MTIRKALVHRYKNEPDILSVETNGCSDVMTPGRIDFDLVIVIPTIAAKSEIAIVADAASPQYKIRDGAQKHWPGSVGVKYRFRVDVANVRYVSFGRVKNALMKAGDSWIGQWTVKNVEVDEDDLIEPELDVDLP